MDAAKMRMRELHDVDDQSLDFSSKCDLYRVSENILRLLAASGMCYLRTPNDAT